MAYVLCAAALAVFLIVPVGGKIRRSFRRANSSVQQRPAEPRVSLMHRTMCADLTKHVRPVGFDASEPGWDGVSHGESMRSDAVDEQCMCGHWPYYSCADALGVAEPTQRCKDGRHRQCSREGWNDYMIQWQADMCPCDCHNLPLSKAIKEASRG